MARVTPNISENLVPTLYDGLGTPIGIMGPSPDKNGYFRITNPTLPAYADQLADHVAEHAALGIAVGGYAPVATSTYTLSVADKNLLLVFTSNCTVTVPNTLLNDFVCQVTTSNVSTITFVGSGCTIVNAYGHTKTNSVSYELTSLIRSSPSSFLIYGATGT